MREMAVGKVIAAQEWDQSPDGTAMHIKMKLFNTTALKMLSLFFLFRLAEEEFQMYNPSPFF